MEKKNSLDKEDRPTGVTLKALVVGVLLCLCIAVGEPYGVLVAQGSPMCADFSTGGAIFLFFILVFVINVILRRIHRAFALSRGELITVYIMMIIACAIPSWGFTMNLIPVLAGVFYFATPENRWVELIHPNVPKWLVPHDSTAIRQFFEGLPKGGSIPWIVWLKPLLFWCSLIVVVYFVMICIMVILRKQWIEKERLLFPLVQLPLAMTEEGEKATVIPPFFKDKIMWMGFAIPFLIASLNALHSYFIFIPGVNLSGSISIMRNTVYMPVIIFFEVIGLAYLISTDISLSLWLFTILGSLQMGIFNIIGFRIGPTQPGSGGFSPSIAHQAIGAMIVLVVSGLWFARSHLKDVFSKAFTGNKDIDDSDEVLSYRTAVFGLIGGMIFITIWLMAAGLSFLHTIIFLIITFIIFIGITRVVAQTGLAYGRPSVTPVILSSNMIGGNALGASGLTVLAFTWPWAMDIRTLVMTSAANGFKLGDAVKLKRRKLFLAIFLAILIGLFGSIWAVINLAYNYGGINFERHFFRVLSPGVFNWVKNFEFSEGIKQWNLLSFMGIGGILMGGLVFLRNRFLWWPVHPIGLAVGCTYPMGRVWFSVFIAWILKSLIIKYGGAKLFRRLRPFFLGLVLGGFSAAGMWLIIDFFTGMQGNFFTLG